MLTEGESFVATLMLLSLFSSQKEERKFMRISEIHFFSELFKQSFHYYFYNFGHMFRTSLKCIFTSK